MSPRKDAMSMSPREMGDRRVTLELFFHAFMTLITTSCAADQIDSISDPTVTTYPMATNAPEMTPTIPPTIVELASLSPEEMQTLVDRAPLVQKLVNGEVKSENISFNWGEKTASVKTEILEATYTLDTIHQATVEIAGKPVEVTFVGGVMLDLEGKFVGLAKIDKFPEPGEKDKEPWFTPEDVASRAWAQYTEIMFEQMENADSFAGSVPVGSWLTFDTYPRSATFEDIPVMLSNRYLRPEADINKVLYGKYKTNPANFYEGRDAREVPLRILPIYSRLIESDTGNSLAVLVPMGVLESGGISLLPIAIGDSLVETDTQKGKYGRSNFVCSARLPECTTDSIFNLNKEEGGTKKFLTPAVMMPDATLDPLITDPALAQWMKTGGAKFIATPDIIEQIISGEMSIKEASRFIWSAAKTWNA